MLFNSLDFAIFFPTVFIVYWIFSKHLTLRNTVILLSSYLFYGWWDWHFLILIIISSTVDYYVGLKLFKAKEIKTRKAFLALSLIINLGFLFYFKYTNFFIETFVDSFRLFGSKFQISTLNIILPVGISFYTFQTLSYTIDIYRKQIEPTKDLLSFFTFVAFFPQLVAGPIERASHLLPQFHKTYRFDYAKVKSGLLLMGFGLFKKMVIADRAAILVNQVYSNPSEHAGHEIVLATILFAFQIYCDFSGYSDIAIGAARTMGFDLMKNFDSPYFSKSVTEFWRRWHTSLSTWFRDYVYIPLGGNRKGKYRTYANLFTVFVVSGLWHGAAMTFVIWGAIHGLFIIFEKAITSFRKRFFNSKTSLLLGVPLTFFIVCFAWIFFRAETLKQAFTIIQNSQDTSNISMFDLALGKYELILLFSMIALLLIIEIVNTKYRLYHLVNRLYLPIRWMLYLFMFFIVLIFGIYGDDTIQEFIYFQF